MKTQGNRENVLSPYALWGLAGPRRQRRRTSCVHRLSSFDDRQAMYEASWPLHRLLIGLYDYQACSVGLKMDVYMHRPQESQEPKHSQQIDRVRGDDVLAKEHCLYERDSRLRCEDENTSLHLSAMCGLLLFFLRSWQSRRRSETGCYSARRGVAFHCIAWEMIQHWRKKQPVSTSLGVFRHEVARTDLPRKT